MVRKLTVADEAAINEAIQETEKHTSAKISVVVLPSSDHYRDFVLLYGFALGSAVSCALWAGGISIFPLLLSVQLGVIILVDLIPWLRRICIRLVPRSLCHRRASEAAYFQYHVLHADLPKDEPFALLFVSLAEHYVHVVTNPVIHKKIPDHWNAITDHFIGSMRKEGLRAACIQAIKDISKMLAPHFSQK